MVSIAVIIMTQSNLGRRGFMSLVLPKSQSTIKGSLCKNSRLEHRGRNGNKDHGGMFTGLLYVAHSDSFLIQPRRMCPRLALPTVV